MLKLISYPVWVCLIIYGVWLILAAGQYKEKFEKAKDWNTVEGRIIHRDEGVDFAMYNPVTWPKLFICDPSITFAYTVNGKRYEKTDKLPPVFVFTRIATRGDYDPNAVYDDAKEMDFEQIMNESAALRAKNGPKEQVDLSKHIYVENDKVQFRGLGKLGKAFSSTEEEKDLFRPRVDVKYRAGDPEEAITAKDMIKGYDVQYQSGLWSIIIGVLAIAAMAFHAWVTKPVPEDEQTQFQGRSSVRY